ncbi:MAG: TIR domain-containing protein [Clostridia bacterium]|nr:TIR domain-containing protein [Clostridia bacterium]
MLNEDYHKLIHEVDQLSKCIEETIQLIHRVIEDVLIFLGNNDGGRVCIDAYNTAIQILEEVINNNEILYKAAEAYLCCYSESNSRIDFGAMSQLINQKECVPNEKDDITAGKSAERRKALVDALGTGQPIMVDLDRTDSITSDNSNEQSNVSDSVNACGDDVFEAITVPSGKLAGGDRCRICDTPVFADTVFCPKCGSKIVIEKSAVQLSQVEFSAIAPKQIVKGEYSIIDIVMYEEAYRHIVDEIHSQSETEAQEKKSGKIRVTTEANIKVVLYSNDIEIEDNEMTGVWQNSYLNFSFPIFLPDNYSKKQVLFVAKIFINDIIATRLTFTARCSSLFDQKINVIREDVLTAFISYASQDRKKVATIVQGMQKARPDMDLFFDVESLRSGENWEKTLFNEIEKRDILYLCWSHHAKNSEWVDKEWRYAYSQKGIDGIEPMPIELPEDCPPPQELSGKHWNDKLLYLIGHSNKNPSERTLPNYESRWVDDTWG